MKEITHKKEKKKKIGDQKKRDRRHKIWQELYDFHNNFYCYTGGQRKKFTKIINGVEYEADPEKMGGLYFTGLHIWRSKKYGPVIAFCMGDEYSASVEIQKVFLPVEKRWDEDFRTIIKGNKKSIMGEITSIKILDETTGNSNSPEAACEPTEPPLTNVPLDNA